MSNKEIKMAIEEYIPVAIPAFVTLGSLGILYPYFVEGFILISFILFIVLFLIRELLDKVNLTGYYDILLASLSVIFAFSYFQKLSTIFMITGVIVLSFAIYTIFVSTKEIKYPY